MPALFFTNLWMLAGLAALTVPILVHLLLRRKKKRLRFSTVQFFLRQDEHASQRRKLRNWFLLTLRLLICALLVLAFARPYLQSSDPLNGGAGKRQVAFVLDRSLSMQAESVDGPKWTRAREALRQMIAELKPGDRAALVGCGSRAEVLSEWAPPSVVAKLASDLQPACGFASLDEGLQQARRLLTFADPAAAVQICIISDLQRTGCQNLSSCPIGRDVSIKTIKVGDAAAPNLAITDLQMEQADGARPHATVTSFSEEDSPATAVDLVADGKVVGEFTVNLPAGASTNLDLATPGMAPGWHDIQIRLRKHDGLPLDDSRFAAVFVPNPLRTLVVEPRRGKPVFEEESFFVAMALDPGKGSSNGIPSRFSCEKISPDELAARLGQRQAGRACDLVVLPGLRQLPSGLANALTAYVQAGGGLLLFAGESINTQQYNAELDGLLPARLGGPETAPGVQLGWHIGTFGTNTPMFSPFGLPNSGDLSLVRLFKRLSLLNTGTNAVIAQFDDGAPLVVSRQAGAGRVVFVDSSADTAWNDWPKHKTFVPWLHGTGHYLTPGARSIETSEYANLSADREADIDLSPAAAKLSFKLRQPDGKEVEWKADDDGQLRGMIFSRPGIYTLRDASGVEVRRLAVNVPVQESDLSALAAPEFEQQLARAPETQRLTLASLFGSSSNHRELWRVLLAAAVGLLLLEMVVANRTLA